MQQAGVPLYLDWSFWVVIVAAIAVVLSQLPPIHQLVRPGKLVMELYSRIAVSHKVGNPNVQLHVILTNAGGRSVRVKGITLRLRRDGKDVAVLPAQNYLQEPNDKSTLLFTSFSIKPKEEWAHIVSFLNYFSRADEKKYRAAELALKTDIREKKELPENKDRLIQADNKNVKPFAEMFDEKFVWQPGEYEMQVTIESPGKKTRVERKYRFTLFESDSIELSAAKRDFKFGDGIYWDSGNHIAVLVQIVEA
jgi:hypothetical protein